MGKSSGPAWLPDLGEGAPHHELIVPSHGEPNWAALPSRAGVVTFDGHDGQAILIATSADLRALAMRRIGVPGPEAPVRSSAADLRAVTAKISAIETTSALEADAIYLRIARERMPETHRVVSERWRAWFVHVDPSAAHPQWTKTNLFGLVAPRSASAPRSGSAPGLPGGLVIGPIADKDTAGRLIESVIDAFDLCRYHHLLVQAPCAIACAYKEMGRCAAPCDGSESIDSYQARTLAAARHLIGDREPLARSLRERMSAAAEVHDFERAAVLKQTLIRLESLDRPAFRNLSDLYCWQRLLVLPSGTPRRVRCVLLAGATLGDLGPLDLDAETGTRVASIAHAAMASCVSAPPVAPTLEQVDTIAAVSRWLHMPATRRRGEVIDVTHGAGAADFAAWILAAAGRVARPSRSAKPRQELEERELEVLSLPATPSCTDAAASTDDLGTHGTCAS